ncbi:Uu.00g008310.m01.CDS01 [Anthostomella pinea]|uniref:Uu.00g008310.m01.CDS01 n=1 Tax=Anthostomella pinea TaxID=933095 RepID=A0AAI8VX53_9PEZI|nr:Uu.00g008310.m01.CDS01 [Anthostomella pinea]
MSSGVLLLPKCPGGLTTDLPTWTSDSEPFIIAETALIFWWIDLGLGKHAITVPPADLAEGPKIIFIAAFLYDCNIALPKFSALFFYRRIFERTSRWLTVTLWTVAAMNAGWLFSAWISTIFQCTPVNAAWETVPESTCISQWTWFLGTAIPSIVIDFLILIIPLPMLWGLQASASRRIMVGAVFICGYS